MYQVADTIRAAAAASPPIFCLQDRHRNRHRNRQRGRSRVAPIIGGMGRISVKVARMYLEYYGLTEAPFSITPDPRYVFLSDRHREALAHLLYGVGKGGGSGFVQLTGEVGTGKTTVCRLLLEQLPEDTRVALVLNPKLSPLELLLAVCEELGVEVGGRQQHGQKELVDTLNHYLLDAYAQGLQVVLIVDEAQELSRDSLEQIRLLTNLETPTQKLLQIILLGQPELRQMLDTPDLRQLAQRITARYHLEPLDAEETRAYVRHRLQVAGLEQMPFTRLGLTALYQRSGGIPRVINIVADRAMTAGFALDKDKLGEQLVHRAADEALPGRVQLWWRRLRLWLLLAGLAVAVAVAWGVWHSARPLPPSAPATVATAATEASSLQRLRQALGDPVDAAAVKDAWSYLMARWQVGSDEATVAEVADCPAVVAPGLRCLQGSGSLRQIRQFNRPVLLALGSGAADNRRLAVLLGIGKTRVRLRFHGARYTIPKTQLASMWQGDFTALFRAPPDVPDVLKRGDAGPATAWVAQQLALFDQGPANAAGPSFYDAALEARVRRLQQGFGLVTDGIVGSETLFALASLNQAGPHLAHGVP